MQGYHQRLIMRVVCPMVLAPLILVAACEEDVPLPVPLPAPAPAPVPRPLPVPPQPAPTPARAPQPLPDSTKVRYPLSNGQALGYLQLGYPVAGALPSGLEGLASQTEITEYVNKQVQKEKCEYEWDYLKEENVRKCRLVYDYERVPVAKKVWQTSNGVSRQTFTSALAAINAITQAGAVHWRLVN